MEYVDKVCTIILTIFGILQCYRVLYLLLGFFFKAKTFPPTDYRGKYGIIICARNEERVIGALIDSIHKQTYDNSLLTIFIAADNCTDATADICRKMGAVVYERFEPGKARKGYALEFLYSHIDEDYGLESFDGFFVFDADNLLAADFVEEMNKAFAVGNDMVTSYRNTKNFDTNWISSAYGIHFYNNTLTKHRPRSLLKLGTHLTGTGYLLRSSLLKDGWHYINLTEDDEFTTVTASRGVKIDYCEAAEFYDEQPYDFKTVYRQRVRWAKGRLNNFFRNAWRLVPAIFKYKSFTDYDLFFHYFPYGLFSWIIGLLYPLCSLIYGAFNHSYDYGGMLFNVALALGSQYLSSLATGLLTVLREHRHIHCSLGKLVFYIFVYPWFNMIAVYIYLIAVFKRVTWLPIPHDDNRHIEDV